MQGNRDALEFTPRESRQSGFMLLIVPVIVIALIIMGAQMISRSRTGMKMAANNVEYLQVELCSQQCASLAVNASTTALNNWMALPVGKETCQCKTSTGLPVQTCERTLGTVTTKETVGCYGVKYTTTILPIISTCKDAQGQKATLEMDAELNEIPIFQFAFFYDKYLEIQPGKSLSINGRIHSNDTIQITPLNDLKISDWITTPDVLGLYNMGGKTFFGMKDMSGSDKSGLSAPNNFTKLHDIIGSSNWLNWKKNHLVAYENQGNDCPSPSNLSLPFKKITDYHALIDWRDSTNDEENLKRFKYSWKADLIFRKGNWHNKDMSPAQLGINPFVLPPGFKVSTTNPNRITFWEPRDALMLQLLPIDLAKLQQRATDGIIYLHDTLPDPVYGNKHVGGFLLYNGAKLLRPLTIVSSTRLALYGNYNTQNDYTTPSGSKWVFPSSLVSDVMLHLSTEFNFEEHTLTNHPGQNGFGSPMNPKSKYRLVLNSNVMTGMIKQNGTQRQQGGVNNLVRNIENWDESEYEKNGSMVSIWYSRDSFGGHVGYYAPVRIWSFDTLYNDIRNMPPGTPRLVNPSLASWQFMRK